MVRVACSTTTPSARLAPVRSSQLTSRSRVLRQRSDARPATSRLRSTTGTGVPRKSKTPAMPGGACGIGLTSTSGSTSRIVLASIANRWRSS
jgi:hypothetical protein